MKLISYLQIGQSARVPDQEIRHEQWNWSWPQGRISGLWAKTSRQITQDSILTCALFFSVQVRFLSDFKMASPKPATASRRKEASSHTKDKANAAKAYIEAKYSKLKQSEEEKKQGWSELQAKMDEMTLSNKEQQLIRQEILQREAQQMRQQRRKITVFDFEPLAIIGKGAFGEVRVVRHKQSGEILAMKKMNKNEMVYKN